MVTDTDITESSEAELFLNSIALINFLLREYSHYFELLPSYHTLKQPTYYVREFLKVISKTLDSSF